MPVKAKYIKDLPLKRVLDGSESLLVQDLNGTQQAPLGTIVDEIKQNSQEKIREIESELNQTNAQLSETYKCISDYTINNNIYFPNMSESFSALENTNALQKTINEVVLRGGGTIQLPIGTFDVFGCYIEGDNVVIKGHGIGLTTLNQVATTDNFLNTIPSGIFSDVKHTRIFQIGTSRKESNYNVIEKMTLVGKKGKDNEQAEWSNCIHIWQSHYNTIQFCELKNGLNYSIDIGADFPLRATNTVDPINIRNSNYNKILNCVESGSGTISVAITSGDYNEVMFNNFKSTIDLEFNDVDRSSIRCNKVVGNNVNSSINIVCRTNTNSLNVVKDNIITQNNAKRITLQYADNTKVVNNNVAGEASSLIEIRGCTNTIVESNTIRAISSDVERLIYARGVDLVLKGNIGIGYDGSNTEFIGSTATFGEVTSKYMIRENNQLVNTNKYASSTQGLGEKSYYKVSRTDGVISHKLLYGNDILSDITLTGANDTINFFSNRGGNARFYVTVINQPYDNGSRVGVKLLPIGTSVAKEVRTFSLLKDYYDATTNGFKQAFFQTGDFTLLVEVIY